LEIGAIRADFSIYVRSLLTSCESVVNGRSSSTTRGVLASSEKTLMGRRLKEHLKTSLPLGVGPRPVDP
jgi:hypothetical protein